MTNCIRWSHLCVAVAVTIGLLRFLALFLSFLCSPACEAWERRVPDRRQPLVHLSECMKVDHLPMGWCMDSDENPRYVGNDGITAENGSGYQIMRYSHSGFQKCLANKTVVVAGDSRTRYQFMHLASFLRAMQFVTCSDQTANVLREDYECLAINERLQSANDTGYSWNEWYNTTTKMLTGQNLHTKQDSLCDCFRAPVGSPGGVNSHWFENRYVKHVSQHGEINLIHLQNFQNLTFECGRCRGYYYQKELG